MNHMAELILDKSQGEPVSNTVKLRNEYGAYKIQAESNGEPAMSFEEWVKVNYPEKPILSP